MRNPNGYGSVVKLKGNRRRPFRVRKTVGFNEKGHPIIQVIAYTETREEGLVLLAAYYKNPRDVDAASITFADIFKLWTERKAPRTTVSIVKMMKTAYKNKTEALRARCFTVVPFSLYWRRNKGVKFEE